MACARRRVGSVAGGTVAGVRAINVPAHLGTADVGCLDALVDVLLTPCAAPAGPTNAPRDGVAGDPPPVALAGLAATLAVLHAGTRLARACVAAQEVTRVARAGEAAHGVDARLAAQTLAALVLVDAGRAVDQDVAGVAEAGGHKAVAGVVRSRTALFASCVAARLVCAGIRFARA